ncbi:LOW QUALITY PROTEIN: hypothetical protein KUTeg_005092, partial [Tegillarca granosa]
MHMVHKKLEYNFSSYTADKEGMTSTESNQTSTETGTPARRPPKYKWGQAEDEEIMEIQTSSGFKIQMLHFDGNNYALDMMKMGFAPDPRVNNQKIKDMDIRDDDVIICAFPKCGTQWSWEVVSMLMKKAAEYEKRIKTVGMLEFHEPQEFDQLESPRVLNTHLPFRNLPKKIIEKKCKIVYIQRNPKDVAVSFYNHKKNMFGSSFKQMTWEDHLELFPSKYSVTGIPYTLDWEKVIDDNPNLPIHCMYYEDLKMDPFTETKRLAQFLGKDCDDQLIWDICEKCSFHNMKNAREVGDWKNWFTVAQNERFDAEYNERMKDSKLKFTYILESIIRRLKTWTSEMMTSSYVPFLNVNKAEYEKRIKTVAMLEFGEPQEFDKLESPRVFNSHLPFRNIPKQIIEKKCKIILNPKDVAVSFYNHKKNLFHSFKNVTWEDHLELFSSKYSGRKKDPFTATKNLAQFLGKECDDQLIRDICEKCTFKNMQIASTEVKEAPDWQHLPPGKGKELHRSLYRKGEVGDWKNWFTVAQNERFDAEYNEKMKDSKILLCFGHMHLIYKQLAK